MTRGLARPKNKRCAENEARAQHVSGYIRLLVVRCPMPVRCPCGSYDLHSAVEIFGSRPVVS